jgi:serine/threonine protein phosphatase PrpC
MSFLISAITDRCTDKIHKNQDKYGAVRILDANGREILLAVVSDGISRGFEGKYASYNAVLWLLNWAVKYFPQAYNFSDESIAEEIDHQLKLCNDTLNMFSERMAESDTCCTVCGIVTDGIEMVIFNAGDSRVYELNPGGSVRRLTKDDRSSDGKSISMHIGGKNRDDLSITFSKGNYSADNIYFLCSDGMYRKLDFALWRNRFFSARKKIEYNELLLDILDYIRDAGEMDDVTGLIVAGDEDI